MFWPILKKKAGIAKEPSLKLVLTYKCLLACRFCKKSNTNAGDNAKAQDTSNEDAKAVKSTNGFKEEEESKEDATKVTKEYT